MVFVVCIPESNGKRHITVAATADKSKAEAHLANVKKQSAFSSTMGELKKGSTLCNIPDRFHGPDDASRWKEGGHHVYHVAGASKGETLSFDPSKAYLRTVGHES